MKHELDNIFKSEVHAKIISFFHENQTSIDTPRGIAAWTGYERSVVRKALADLTRIGVLIAHPVSSTTGYSYTRDEKMVKKIDKKFKKMKGG